MAKKGEKLSEETKRRLSESKKGKRTSIKTEFKKGHKSLGGMLGKHHSEESRYKISQCQIGKKHTKETKLKMSKAGKKVLNSGRFKKGHKSFSGKNHPNWKGGITPLTQVIRHCYEYRQWRSDVFTRDNFTCQNCNNRGGILHPHHLKLFSKIIEEYNIKSIEQALECEELWNINNGITLCKGCHKIIHSNTYKNV